MLIVNRPRNRRIAEEQLQEALHAEAEAGAHNKADDKLYEHDGDERKKTDGMVQRVISA